MGTAPGAAETTGHAVYTRTFLRVYDWVVLRIYLRWVWRVPLRRIRELYQRQVARPHLDVGPGTGYFLERADLRPEPDVTLLDPNPDVLAYAASRLRGLAPRVVRADVREPLPVSGPYGSVGLSLVLHCLPGGVRAKAAAVRNLADVLAPGGVLFGATILADPQHHTALSRLAMRQLNRRGVFSNVDDTAEAVRTLLEASFAEVTLEVVGTAALFTARRPRPPLRSARPSG